MKGNDGGLIWGFGFIWLIASFIDLTLTQINIIGGATEINFLVSFFYNLNGRWGILVLLWVKSMLILSITFYVTLNNLENKINVKHIIYFYVAMIFMTVIGVGSNIVYMVAK